jgi:hypothetical protein
MVEQDNTVIDELHKEEWFNRKWRPAMAWTYMAICIFDFIVGPVFFNLLQYFTLAQQLDMWSPLTLQGSGLIHLAFGAILGISAWTRGNEKVEIIKAVQSPVTTRSTQTTSEKSSQVEYDPYYSANYRNENVNP